mmetsp:Transcript_22052/g.70423  ORF Transcript_22052/g.70423 Transcript_22052/m.70423 type:complete len:265 (+) Transcript_22052:388-1182(+)
MVQPSTPHSSAASAAGFHFAARDHRTPSRFAMPLIRMVARPRRTSSCGKAAIALIGESGESSALEKPPGIGASGSPNRRRARAAAASSGASSTNVTPNSAIDSFARCTSLGEPPVCCHSSTERTACASLSRKSVEICLTCPQSMRATRAPSIRKMLPGCGSPWMKPAPSIIRPKASVSCARMRRPASSDSGLPGLMPRSSSTAAILLSGVPGMKSITSTRRDASPGTGRGTATAGSAGLPPAVCETLACTLSALCASCRKSSSP